MKIKLIIAALLLFIVSPFLKSQEIPDFNKVQFSPDPAYVDVDGKVVLNLIYIMNNDTSRVKMKVLENWMVDGNPDPEHLTVSRDNAYYSPKGQMPANNPVTISVQYTIEKGESKQVFVTRVFVIENKSHFTLSSLNGTTRSYDIENTSFSNMVTAGSCMGFYSRGQNKTACALNDIKTTIGASISFTGNKTGSFSFSKENAIGINLNGIGYMCADGQGNPTTGTMEVTKYDKTGGNIKVNVNGIVNDGNGNPYILNGTFVVKRSTDVD